MAHTYIIVLIILLSGCKQDNAIPIHTDQNGPSKNAKAHTFTTYNFGIPDETYILDANLKEISGLAYNKSSDVLLAHNDEKGSFYDLDISNGTIIKKTKFASKGDYEGIEIINDQIIISKHTGKLFIYDLLSQNTEEYKTVLSAKNDVEGLCYYAPSNTLLLACKGQSLTETKTKKEKCVYTFDLNSKKLNSDPFLKIEDDILVQWVKENYKGNSQSQLKKQVKKIEDFSPSGISYNIDLQEIYIISAKGSTVLIYDNNKNLKHIQFLNNKTIPQPEGICFDKDNNLYISTEGQGYSGKIFKFNYHGK